MARLMRESMPSEARSTWPAISSTGTPISSAIVARMASIMSSSTAADTGVAGLVCSTEDSPDWAVVGVLAPVE